MQRPMIDADTDPARNSSASSAPTITSSRFRLKVPRANTSIAIASHPALF